VQSGREDSSKLVVRVFAKAQSGQVPVAGAEVFAFVDGGAYYACTDEGGKAVLDGLPSGGHVAILAAGPSVVNNCANRKFIHPETGVEMYVIFYKNHRGVEGMVDQFDLPEGGKKAVKMVTRAPNNGRRVCGGFKATHVGTKGDDRIVGTDGPDIINARGGDDIVMAGAGKDRVCGGPGADELFGEAGEDWLWGSTGMDFLDGGDGENDWLFGGGGTDTCVNGENVATCEA